MKITGLLLLIVMALGFISCEKTPIEANFEDVEQESVYDYLVKNKEKFSSFLAILEKAKIDKTLSAYNPKNTGYTVFAPNNSAIDRFISGSELYNSLDELLNDQIFIDVFSRYHIVNNKFNTNEFPFGAFPDPTLSGDYLTVSFAISADSSVYKINNQTAVINPNIELSNGYLHEIQEVLIPVTKTTYEWLAGNSGFSIFKAAIDLVGLDVLADINVKEVDSAAYITILAEPDSVYNRSGIYTIDHLVNLISPARTDYTNITNPLYNYVAYHFLEGNYFLDDFAEVATNYSTYSEVPLFVNGLGLDLLINKGKQIFDTIVSGTDTTIVDYTGFYYDFGNIVTLSGPVHLINQVMLQQTPSRAAKTFNFQTEELFMLYKTLGGTFLLENPELLDYLEWEGFDLFYSYLGADATKAQNGDFLFTDGDFTIHYTVSRIVQGRYKMFINAEQFNSSNALIEVQVDGKLLGSKIDLSTGGSATTPFRKIEVGIIDFNTYSEHVVTVKSLIPGRFLWDYVSFEPY